MTSPALNRQTASMLARQLSQRQIRAEDIVTSCLERIAEREPHVQAWMHIAADAARQTARQLDHGAVNGLLHGLPVGVKDLFDTFDMPTTYGSPIYASHQPLADASIVALARQQGAIMLGKTVTTEFATFKPGKTRNPHNLAHTPGGSSSGSAAAVADYMVPLAFGSQTAASVIRPAAFCGIVGYKPSLGLINRAGVKPLSEFLDTLGFFSRTVEDAALFAAAITNERDWFFSLSTADANDRPTIALCRTHEWSYADADTQAAMLHAEKILRHTDPSLSYLALPASFAGLLTAQIEIMGVELVRSLAHEWYQHAALISPALQGVLEAGMRITPDQHRANLALAQQARLMVPDVFGNADVILAPSAIGAAPATIGETGNPVFGRVWTLLGLPCVHLPFFASKDGMPVGLQVIGRHGQDKQVLRAAKWLESRLIPGLDESSPSQ